MIRFFTLSILTYYSLHYIGFSTELCFILGIASGTLIFIAPFTGLVTLICSLIYSSALCKLLAPELFQKIINVIEKTT
jgi:hypothetical protein